MSKLQYLPVNYPKLLLQLLGRVYCYAAKANLNLEKFTQNLPNGYDEAIQLVTDKWNKINMLQEINNQLEKSFGESKKLLMAQKSEVMKSLSIINDDIDKITQTYPSLGITTTDDPKTIFDKVIGHTKISKNVFNLLGNETFAKPQSQRRVGNLLPTQFNLTLTLCFKMKYPIQAA